MHQRNPELRGSEILGNEVWENESFKLPITNCILFVLFSGANILVAAKVLPFRQGICTGVFVRRSLTCGYEGYCLSGKREPVKSGGWRLEICLPTASFKSSVAAKYL
jgi:hypothetical protein